MWVAVWILNLASLEAELPLGGSFTSPFNANVTKIIFNILGLNELVNSYDKFADAFELFATDFNTHKTVTLL